MAENLNQGQAEEMTLKELILSIQEWWRYLLSKWYILLIAGVLGAGLGFLYAKSKKPLYTASTTFVLEAGDSGVGGVGQMAGLAAIAGVDLGGGTNGLFQGDNLFALYKSRLMIEKALLSPYPIDSNILLIDKYIQFNKFEDVWMDGDNLKRIDFALAKSKLSKTDLRLRDSVLETFVNTIVLNNLKVEKADKKSSIIKVEVTSLNEDFSKCFSEVLVRTVNNFYTYTKTKKSLDNIGILQQKTDSVSKVLSGAISSAAIVYDETPNLNPIRQAQRVIPAQRAQVTTETNKAILGQLVQNLELSKVSLLKETPLIQVVDEPVYPLVKKIVSKKYFLIGGFVFFGFLAVLLLIMIRFIKQL